MARTTKPKNIDITKSGPMTFRDLQKANQKPFTNFSPEFQSFSDNIGAATAPISLYDARANSEQLVSSSLSDTATPWGGSMFDENTATEAQFQRLGNIRAENQPWYSKLGAGIAKGVALAGTTFLDGTIGLVSGIASMPDKGISGLWHNEVSNTLADLNKSLETILSNYRTEEENNNAWYQNLDTMNFWADGFIKNLGFTVGAFYSGGAWNKALKALGWLKGSLGAKAVGSTLSALNEGRIEANQNSTDFLNLQTSQINDMYEKRRDEILSSNMSNQHKQLSLLQLEGTKEKLLSDAKEKADAMGLTTLIGNTILLSLDNYAQFGKLYARGFKNASGLKSGIKKAAEEQALEEAGKNIIKQGSKYAWKDITTKSAIGKGLRNGLMEGNEELAQAFIADTAGNMQSPDSPDSYYNALIDHKAQIETQDFLKATAKGFVDTYGNGDRWEEFAVGALTGILGMPTFGKVNNSDANTYLGRGKTIGLSGGLFGEMGYAKQQNKEGKESVDIMNKFVDKVNTQKGYFAQSKSFTDAMDGWADEKDAFEYKNAEDNETFSAINRFAKTGKLGDLKEMVSQDFENLDDNALADIAMNTSPNVEMNNEGAVLPNDNKGNTAVGGWRNVDGSLMSDTEEGRTQMREELSKKRDKILGQIDSYEKSLQKIRAIGNNSLNEDQVSELAWLDWKVGRFEERFKEITNESEPLFRSVSAGLEEMEKALLEEQPHLTKEDKDSEGNSILSQNKKMLSSVKSAKDLINRIIKGDTQALGILVNPENKEAVKNLSSEGFYRAYSVHNGLKYTDYKNAITALQDTVKLLEARKTFNDRLTEFIKDPLKLIQNRESINKKNEKVKTANSKINLKDKLDSKNVSDIVQEAEKENVDLDMTLEELDEFFASRDKEGGTTIDEDKKSKDATVQKVKEAKQIINRTKQAKKIAQELGSDESVDPKAIEDAVALIEASKQVSDSNEELFNTASQAYNDPSNLPFDEDDSMKGLTQEELDSVMTDRIDSAKGIVRRVLSILDEKEKELSKMPPNSPTKQDTASKVSGKDGSEKIPSVNSSTAANKNKETSNDLEDIVNAIITPEISDTDKAAITADVDTVLKGIDLLISSKADVKNIHNIITNTEAYKRLVERFPNIKAELNNYVVKKGGVNKKSKSSKAAKVTNTTEVEKVSTPIITQSDVETSSTKQLKDDPNKVESLPKYQYWKPTITQYPIHHDKGDNRPYYEIAKSLKNPNGTPKYTAQQLRRMEVVYKYLEDHSAFNFVNSGKVKVGDTIKFVVDSSLNESAGEFVILMAAEDGTILGDVMSENDSTFSLQQGLPQFVDRIKKEYEDAGKPDTFISKEVSKVSKNMIGEVPYLADDSTNNTLNEVGGSTNGKANFKLGIAVSSGMSSRILAEPGRTKKQGQSKLEMTIVSPLDAKAGQPYLLVPTSSETRKYMCAPFIMAPYSPETANTKLGRAVNSVLSRIASSNNDTVISVINDLEELISVKEIHINYYNDRVRVTIKPNAADTQMRIYDGPVSEPTLVQQLEAGLQGQPFQVSRKYINTDYNGEDYNLMIGEIAKINLPIMPVLHTVNDWFTVNPLSTVGTVDKARSPKTLGYNPNKAATDSIRINMGNYNVNVNPSTWVITTDKGVVLDGVGQDLIRAKAYGVYTNQDMTKPYDTNWGYYNPVTNKFEKKKLTLGQELITPKVNEATKNMVDKLLKASPIYTGKDYSKKEAVKEIVFTINGTQYHGKILENGTIWVINASKMGDNDKVYLIENPSTDWNSMMALSENKGKASISSDSMRDKVKEAGLLNNEVRQAVWEALSQEQQQIIYSKLGRPKAQQLMDGLEMSFDMSTKTFNEAKLKGNVDTFLGRKGLYRKADAPNTTWNKDKEIAWLSKVLPGLSNSEHLVIVKGLVRITNSANPEFAYGQFKNGVMTIGTMAASGTLYHEAFHAVTHTLLSSDEYNSLFNSAKEKYGDLPILELEEALAEDFRRYVQLEETPLVGNIVKIFRTLKHLVNNLMGNEPYLNKVFYNINRGKYANRTLNSSDAVRNRDDISTLQSKLHLLDTNYRKAQKMKVSRSGVFSMQSSSKDIIENSIKKEGMSDVLYATQKNNSAYFIPTIISRQSYHNKRQLLQDQIHDLWWSELSDDDKLSNKALQDQEAYYRRIEQYHRDKLEYGNLSQEDRNYIDSKNISPEEYKEMTELEKNILLRCKY